MRTGLVLVSPTNPGDNRGMSDDPSETGPDTGNQAILFSAVLHPATSLSGRGFCVLMVALCAVSFAAGYAFAKAGAWPVLGFFGLDILLIYIAFHVSYRRARRYETVRLTANELAVEKIDPNGRTRRWEFQPYWLRVAIDDAPRYNSALTLNSHGRSVEIGAFLTPEERRDVAFALEVELRRLRGQNI